MTKKKPQVGGNTATYEQIRAAAELAKLHGEPIRDRLLYVFPQGLDALKIPAGYVLRLERGDDGLWHEQPHPAPYDGPALTWNSEAFAIAAPADEEQ